MKGLLYGAVLLAMTVLAFWATHDRTSSARLPETRVHSIAFDNLYGNLERLPVFVTVGDLAEHAVIATCTPTTCTFQLPLTDGRHEMLMSVEHDGRRSKPALVTLDTRTPKRP
jgi:hypothetical protein